MTKIEIQFKIRQRQGELSRCQSQLRKTTQTIEELEHLYNNLSGRRSKFIENRDYLSAYATEIDPECYGSSIERVYSDNIQTVLKGSKFQHALNAFDRACTKVSNERRRQISDCTGLQRRIERLRYEIDQLRRQLEQA